MIKNKKTKYEAMGFVEALIAIMVVGISSVVLMQIAVNTMQNTIQNEAIDNMTQYAVEGAEIAQDIADRDRALSTNIFPTNADWGLCFLFVREDGEINFQKEGEVFVSYDEGDRDGYKDDAILSEDDEFFRIVCLDDTTTPDPTFVIARVIVGQRNFDGTITKGANVKDYTYMTVIQL